MPFDPATAFLPAGADGIDDWIVPRAAPNPPDRPNHWITPWSAETDASYLDDWIYPDNRNLPTAAAAPGTALPAPSLQTNAANPAISNRPAPPPDPLAAYWALIPASRAGAMAWHPPIFLPPNPFSHENIPASAWVTPLPIFLNSPGQFPLPAPAPRDVPPPAAHGLLGAIARLPGASAPLNAPSDVAAHGLLGAIGRMLAARGAANDPWDAAANGLLGAIARLQPANTDAPASPLDPLNWGASEFDNRLPSPLDNLANPSGSPPSVGSDGFGSTSVVPNNMSGQSLLRGYASFDASRDLIPPRQISQLANPVAESLSQRTGLTFGEGDQPTPQSVLQSFAAPDLRASPDTSESATGYSTVPLDPTGSDRIQLAAGDREKIDPEDIFDPLAPLRTDLYNAARYNLRQIQPNNYALSVSSLRTPGSAPTKEEIGELVHAHRIAQSTQPLADTASRIAGLVEPFAQKFRTVSVLQSSKGTFVASSGRAELEKDQRDAVEAVGATRVPTAAIDAEIAALKYAMNRGASPQFIAASRPFCYSCRKEIEDSGGLITSPTTAVFPLNIPSVVSPLR